MGTTAPTQAERPTAVKPMLSTLVKQPFTDDEYVFEVKWDGYRIIAHCNGEKVMLQSRGGEDYSRKYPSIVSALQRMNLNCILDGEVIYINEDGKPDFDALQRVNGQKAPIVYYAFDLLRLDGKSLMNEKLLERKEKLKNLINDDGTIKYSGHFEDGRELFEHVKGLGLEGIVAKQKASQYIPNDRSKKWLKVTTEKRQEFVIGGWVESEKRNTFRTLLFGAYEKGKLKWKGHAGGGFKERDMPIILQRLKEIEIDKNPFDNDVEYTEGKPHWVKPQLVANIKFATTTKSGKIRKPAIFLGFREDKKASQVQTEIAKASPKGRILKPDRGSHSKDGNNAIHKRSLPTSSGSNWPELEREVIKNQDEFEIDSCTITLYNVDRELWKGITKGDLIGYYNEISKYLLPHLRDRALSLHIKPKGPQARGLYIKDMEDRNPGCADIFTTPRKHKKPGKRDVIDYLVCNNTATLLYAVNLGCIDINPWTSTTHNSLRPDFIVIDLDPSDGDFRKAIQTAKASKDFFDKFKLKAFPKTSGKTGIHLFVPCSAFNFPQARTIAANICGAIHELVPSITTTEVTVADRGSSLYLDPNQNDYADTVASVYSVRPYKHPNVSTPLEWKEINDRLLPEDFSMANALMRIEKKGDLFISTLDRKIAAKNDKILMKFL
ncbi:MAG TPA: DNA ligase D [Ohtaekwangia sp.]|nr:DNA ligase D [Ohtaekwangia sp.]